MDYSRVFAFCLHCTGISKQLREAPPPPGFSLTHFRNVKKKSAHSHHSSFKYPSSSPLFCVIQLYLQQSEKGRVTFLQRRAVNLEITRAFSFIKPTMKTL